MSCSKFAQPMGLSPITKVGVIAKLLIDYSGSVGGQKQYWITVKRILNEFVILHPDGEIFMWDDNCIKLNFEECLFYIECMMGNNGTDPSCFLPLLTEKSVVWIITDGDIADQSVKSLLGKVPHLDTLHVHCISTGNTINMSVAAPFTAVAKSYKVFRGDEVLTESSQEVLVFERYYSDPQAFFENREQLVKAVIVKTMGGIILREPILALQKALLSFVANQSYGTFSGPMQAVSEHLENSRSNAHLSIQHSGELTSLFLQLISPCDDGLSKQIQTAIAELLDACTPRGYSFDLLHRSRISRAPVVSIVETETLPLPIEEFIGEFECPIGLEYATPVICVKNGLAILHDCSKQEMDYFLNNPLAILGNEKLMEKLIARIDCPIGFPEFQNMSMTAKKTGLQLLSPMTREPIVAFLLN